MWITVCAFLIVFASCRSIRKNPERIEIKIGDRHRDQLSIEIESLIPLEKGDNSIIGSASKVRYCCDRIYILDRWSAKSLFVFNDRGWFINKISHNIDGLKISRPFAFDVEVNDSIVLFFDQNVRAFHVFDIDLNYLDYRIDSKVIVDQFWSVGDDDYLVYSRRRNSSNSERKQYYAYFLYNRVFDNERIIPISYFGEKDQYSLDFSVCIKNDTVLFVYPWNYNIYELIGNGIEVKYSLDFGKYGFSERQLISLSSGAIRSKMDIGKKIGIINGIIDNKNFLLISTIFKNVRYNIVVSHSTKKSYVLNDCINSGSMPEIDIRGITDSGLYFGLIEPNKLISFQERTGKFKNTSVKRRDNPYFVLFKIIE